MPTYTGTIGVAERHDASTTVGSFLQPAGFYLGYITSINAPVYKGGQVYVSWKSSAPAGVWYQIYVGGVLAWFGQTLWTWLPIPPAVERVYIGTVLDGQEQVDFSASLPAAPKTRAELDWIGGTYEGADLAGFHVYGEPSPGAGINYGTPLATITAYPAGVFLDGFGMGGFGLGGFGAAAGSYTWTSLALQSGTWHFAVKPFDEAGNEGTVATTAVTINVPPLPPAPYPDRLRLHYTFNHVTEKATLTWNASPMS
jgi:hypothetical protein